MNRVSVNSHVPDVESLFAVEREIVSAPDEVRARAIRRAQAALPHNPRVRLVSYSPSPRRRISKVAGAAVMLSAACALAFYAGYRVKGNRLDEPVRAPAVVPSVVVPSLVSAPSAGSSAEIPSPRVTGSRSARTKPAASPKPVTESEAYARELRVLRPAQQAVARQDFASALAAIAEHQRRFPSGRLAEEREALRVKALLGLGRDADAQQAGATFRKRFPRSALHERMDEMLGTQR